MHYSPPFIDTHYTCTRDIMAAFWVLAIDVVAFGIFYFIFCFFDCSIIILLLLRSFIINSYTVLINSSGLQANSLSCSLGFEEGKNKV
jgi:hypothetical protein